MNSGIINLFKRDVSITEIKNIITKEIKVKKRCFEKKKQYVIFPRIDQKTCLKAIYTANLKPIIVEAIIDGDELRTNLQGIKSILEDPKFKD